MRAKKLINFADR